MEAQRTLRETSAEHVQLEERLMQSISLMIASSVLSEASSNAVNTGAPLLWRVWQPATSESGEYGNLLQVNQGFCNRTEHVRLTMAGASEQ